MNTHRINVLNGTNDHDVVLGITHYLELVLFPADDALFNEDTANRTCHQSIAEHVAILLHVIGNTAPSSAHGK